MEMILRLGDRVCVYDTPLLARKVDNEKKIIGEGTFQDFGIDFIRNYENNTQYTTAIIMLDDGNIVAPDVDCIKKLMDAKPAIKEDQEGCDAD